MISLFLRNLFFTIVHPGLVAGLIPFWILGPKAKTLVIEPWQFHQYPGTVLFIIGMVILVICIRSFAVRGRGTLSPFDPTKQLVVTGLYRFSRNPMYLGVVIILMGEAIFFQSGDLWVYLLVVFVSFNIFIHLHEEPRLRKDFGEQYQKYCQKVARWI